jgi:hypothetical protein
MPKHLWLGHLVAALSLTACMAVPQSSTAANPEILCNSVQWTAVADNVWLAQGDARPSNPENGGFISNAVFVRQVSPGAARGWLVGTGPSPAWGQALRCSLARQLQAQVTDVLSARAHPESVLGLSAFDGLRSWALPEVRDAMRERCQKCTARLAQATYALDIVPASIRLPSLEVETRSTEIAGPLRVAHMDGLSIYALERAPGEWTTVVHARGAQVWITPGLVWGHGLVPDLRDANLDHMIAALEWLASQTPQVLVPEQGRAVASVGPAKDLAYWRRLKLQVAEAVHSGRSLNELLRTASDAGAAADTATGKQRLSTEPHSLNLQRAWQQIEQTYFQRNAPIHDAADLSLR